MESGEIGEMLLVADLIDHALCVFPIHRFSHTVIDDGIDVLLVPSSKAYLTTIVPSSRRNISVLPSAPFSAPP